MISNVQPWRVPGRLAYIVNHSFPYSSDGYAVRTHGVATGLQQLGHSVIVINRPGAPWNSAGTVEKQAPHHHWVDGVLYLFSPQPSRRAVAGARWRSAASKALQAQLHLFKPTAVMAASNWENAQPALDAARAHKLPFFYEVRGFWELTGASSEPAWQATNEYQQIVAHEAEVATQADHVFTLNELMRHELIRRGVNAQQIDLVPNGWAGLPKLSANTASTRQALGVKSRHVIGYIGSFTGYEGLEDLIQATAQLVQSGLDLSLLLVGSGSRGGRVGGACPQTEGYRQLAAQLGLGERFIVQSRVQPQHVARYYQLLDLVVIPRRPLPVTELVSPIKPLEAAAHGRALLLSDVAPLKAFAAEAGAALFRKGDVKDLAKQIDKLLNDASQRQQMGQQLRLWVSQNRLFAQVLRPIQTLIHSHASGRTVPELAPALI